MYTGRFVNRNVPKDTKPSKSTFPGQFDPSSRYFAQKIAGKVPTDFSWLGELADKNWLNRIPDTEQTTNQEREDATAIKTCHPYSQSTQLFRYHGGLEARDTYRDFSMTGWGSALPFQLFHTLTHSLREWRWVVAVVVAGVVEVGLDSAQKGIAYKSKRFRGRLRKTWDLVMADWWLGMKWAVLLNLGQYTFPEFTLFRLLPSVTDLIADFCLKS